jgi:hypothetical protein
MRIREIKEAILHPEEEIREKAFHYFSDAPCQDESIMPLVIEAVEKYGREMGFRLLRDAERLPQTDATVDWLINELRRDYDLSDKTQENHCIAVAWVLHRLPQPVAWKRFNEIFTAPAFPDQLREAFSERLERFSWDWDRGWTALKYWAEDTMRRRTFTHGDIGWANGIVEALARHRKKAKTVLALLEGQYGEEDPAVMDWLRPCFADLAGEMRLAEAVPLLMDYLGTSDFNISFQGDDTAEPPRGPSSVDMADSAGGALQRIGGDLVVREIDARWWHCDNIEFRRSAACLLDHVRGDLCVERCLDFFKGEEDHETKLILADALLGNFSEQAVDLLWKFLANMDDEQLDPEERDLRYRLVAVATIMGRTFPHFDQWREAALRDTWGRFGLKTGRVADTFKPELFGPKWSEN